MREIKYLTLHCTATPQTTTVESIKNHWKNVLGWSAPGYHWLIKPDGTAVNLLPIEEVSNGVRGYNKNSIHISYIGGIDPKGKALDNRTDLQKLRTIELLQKYKKMFPDAIIKGHRDFPNVQKECPSFEVSEWLQCIGIK